MLIDIVDRGCFSKSLTVFPYFRSTIILTARPVLTASQDAFNTWFLPDYFPPPPATTFRTRSVNFENAAMQTAFKRNPFEAEIAAAGSGSNLLPGILSLHKNVPDVLRFLLKRVERSQEHAHSTVRVPSSSAITRRPRISTLLDKETVIPSLRQEPI